MSQKVLKSKNKKVTFFNIFSKMSPKYIIYKNLCSAQKKHLFSQRISQNIKFLLSYIMSHVLFCYFATKVLVFSRKWALNTLKPLFSHEYMLHCIIKHHPFTPFVGCKGSQTSFRIRKGRAVNRLEQFLPPLESKQFQNLFLFIGLA